MHNYTAAMVAWLMKWWGMTFSADRWPRVRLPPPPTPCSWIELGLSVRLAREPFQAGSDSEDLGIGPREIRWQEPGSAVIHRQPLGQCTWVGRWGCGAEGPFAKAEGWVSGESGSMPSSAIDLLGNLG